MKSVVEPALVAVSVRAEPPEHVDIDKVVPTTEFM
jgi:hypothetical protein